MSYQYGLLLTQLQPTRRSELWGSLSVPQPFTARPEAPGHWLTEVGLLTPPTVGLGHAPQSLRGEPTSTTVQQYSNNQMGCTNRQEMLQRQSTFGVYLQNGRLSQGPCLAVQASRYIVPEEAVESLDLPRAR